MLQSLTLGERLEKIRKIKSITLKKFESELGYSAQTISNWENNVTEPGLNEIIQLAKFLNVSYSFLLEGIINNSEDQITFNAIKINDSITYNRAEAYSFVKNIENVETHFLDEMFEITESQVLCNLDMIISHGNLELFKAINQKYDFIIEITANNNQRSNIFNKQYDSRKIKKHPITLEFSDLKNTTNIEFYEYALELLEQNIEKEKLNNKKIREMGYGFSNKINKEVILCNALEDLCFNFNNDAVNDIILFLLDNGAYIKQYIPYETCEGYQVYKDKFMTNFIRSTILNYNRLKEKLLH